MQAASGQHSHACVLAGKQVANPASPVLHHDAAATLLSEPERTKPIIPTAPPDLSGANQAWPRTQHTYVLHFAILLFLRIRSGPRILFFPMQMLLWRRGCTRRLRHMGIPDRGYAVWQWRAHEGLLVRTHEEGTLCDHLGYFNSGYP